MRGYWLRLQERLRAIPGVDAATVMTGLPPDRHANAAGMRIVGRAFDPRTMPPWSTDFWQTVGDDYARTMGLRMASGRWFSESDDLHAPQVVVISEAFARKFFPGEDPIGKQIRVSLLQKDGSPQTIIGVARDVKQQGLDAPSGTEVYIPLRQAEAIYGGVPPELHVVVRGKIDSRALASSVRAAASEIDPTVPLYRLRTMDSVLWDAVARPRFLTFLLGVFAALALIMATVGIYGVLSYVVAQRTRELGIRLALGAKAPSLRRMVLRDGLVLAGLGVTVGLVAAFALNSLLASRLSPLLYDVPVIDVATFVGVAVAVLVVAGIACVVPAIRATRVDPIVALRAD